MSNSDATHPKGSGQTARQQMVFPLGANRGARSKHHGLLDLQVTFDQVQFLAEFVWSRQGQGVALGRIRPNGTGELVWEI